MHMYINCRMMFDYVGTINGQTSITQLGSFENVAKNCQFQFLDPLQNIVASFRIAKFSF